MGFPMPSALQEDKLGETGSLGREHAVCLEIRKGPNVEETDIQWQQRCPPLTLP